MSQNDADSVYEIAILATPNGLRVNAVFAIGEQELRAELARLSPKLPIAVWCVTENPADPMRPVRRRVQHKSN